MFANPLNDWSVVTRLSKLEGLVVCKTKLCNAVLFSAALLLGIIGHIPLPSAAVLIEIQRISNTQGILTGTGALGVTVPSDAEHVISLINPFSTAPLPGTGELAFSSSTLKIGTVPINFAWDCALAAAGCTTPLIYFGNQSLTDFLPGATFSGQLNLQLTFPATFAAIGATGDVYWGFPLRGPELVGTWEIVAPSQVPLPAALPLFATVLAGGGILAWRRKRKATVIS